MSLLNDALRQAEQRQNRAQVTGAYLGQPVAQNSGPWKPLMAVGFVIVLLLMVGAGAWWLPSNNLVEPVASEPVVTAVESEPEPESVTVVTPPTAEAPAVEPTAELVERGVERSNDVSETTITEPPEPEPAVVVQASSQETTAPAAAVNPPSEPSIKQSRETPESIDLRTSRELQRLLSAGQNGEAERRLTELTNQQAAPHSREVFAREMLVQGMAARALNWLPDTLTQDHPDLRLLKARALLEQGELTLAVAMLAARVPPVAEQVEYRITLATLQQQAGQPDEAAGHWSELIAYDDNRPAWWLGLAIALETGGRHRSAVQAYAQAASMPGLAPSLADYARERLNALQAGS
ncbi:tetratricopeptide repeat protein [Marinobacter sp.]|uniref:tetratricopeptide repeat protein n=1 Tax=Marinobacter sp. TaxID=50741 RepID=UPI0025C28B2D|nr:tetratricopeptide repeat protein [Marinobacter sp.]